jgi:hypothetical protein
MARRVCLYCQRDYGEALPRSAWAMYAPETATSGICSRAECEAAHKAIMDSLPADRALAGVPGEVAS